MPSTSRRQRSGRRSRLASRRSRIPRSSDARRDPAPYLPGRGWCLPSRFESSVSAAEPRVLVVDDDENTLAALRYLLEPTGAELRFARTGEEALAQLTDPDFAAV